jgi:hypothetical protein
MKLIDLTERNQQKTMIMYHGTSDLFFKDILKHGLLANPPKRTYDSENGNVGYETYGGVYLTNKFLDARDAARYAVEVSGGYPIIVNVQYVMGSGNIDEDRITYIINNIIYDIHHDYLQMDYEGSFEKYTQEYVGDILDGYIDTAMSRLENIGSLGLPVREAVENVIKLVLEVVGDREIQYQDIMTIVVDYPEYKQYIEIIMRNITTKNPSNVQILRNIGFKGELPTQLKQRGFLGR